MASNKKSKNLRKGIATTTAVASVVLQAGVVAGATVSSENQTAQDQLTQDQTNQNKTNEDQNQTTQNQLTQNKDAQTSSNHPEVPYFYYWTTGDKVYINWDYGHVANRPSKIEAVIDKDISFLNPSYIEVKPKGAEFTPNIKGEFYLRVRFFDSKGSVTHESVRKVSINSTETRDIKGLKYEFVGAGVKLSWANFVEGIKTVKISVDGKLYKELTASDVKDNSYIVENVKDGSEIKITIINGTGLEYNGSVIVKEGAIQQSSLIKLGLSKDLIGIEVNLSNSNFKAGNEFLVNVAEKSSGTSIVSNFKATLNEDRGSFTVYPDEGKSLFNGEYSVKITDVKTGTVYTYDYTHVVHNLSNFVYASDNGQVVASWDRLESMVYSDLMWSTSEDFSTYNTVELGDGKSGVKFNTDIKSGNIYLLLTTYDANRRVLSQNYGVLDMTQISSAINNFKGYYKANNTAEFSWDKVNANIQKAMVMVNDNVFVLSSAELGILNSTSTLTLGGFEKGNKYDVSLYLIDENNKLYSASTSSISESSDSQSSDVTLVAPSGISAKYILNPGVLSLLFDTSIYDISQNSSISITVDGKEIPSLLPVFVKETNAINIKGLIPGKTYCNIVIGYMDSKGEAKSVKIDSLLISKGSSLDSFLINAYNKALSRDTQNIDEEGYNYWKNGLLSKNINLSYFIKNLGYVPEFMNLIKSPDDLITRLYHVLVLRDPEPQGLQFWTNVYTELIANGVSHTESVMKILSDMTTSSEFADLSARIGVNP